MIRSIRDYEEIYWVNNKGEVYSVIRNKYLKTYTRKDGYVVISLHKDKKLKTFYIHLLVAFAFIPNPENKPEVNHKDGNKQNNHVENLEWVTQSENEKHAFGLGLKNQKGEKNGASKLTNEEVLEIRRLYIPRKYSQFKLAKQFNVNRATIEYIVQRKNWKHI